MDEPDDAEQPVVQGSSRNGHEGGKPCHATSSSDLPSAPESAWREHGQGVAAQAEQLTDAEAEAALLALEEYLTWTQRTHDIWVGCVEGRTYSYHYWAKADHFPYMVSCGDVQDGNHRYATKAQTRAACECHYRTGEWDAPEGQDEERARLWRAGVRLVWESVALFNLCDVEIADVGVRRYLISTKKRSKARGGDIHFVHRYRVTSSWRRWEQLPRPWKYLSRLDAKAACERHYATGQWESDHFHETGFCKAQAPE